MSSTLSKLLRKLFILRALLWQIMSRVPDPDFSYKLNPFSQNCTLRSRGCNIAQITWKKHVALVLETWFFGIKWGRMGFCINPILSSFTCESTSMITVYESDGKQLFVVRWSLPWDRPEIRRRCCAEVIVTQITTEAGHSTLHPNCASYRYLVTLLDLIFKMLFGGNIDIYMFWKWWLSDRGVKILKILNFNDSQQTKHHNDKTVTKVRSVLRRRKYFNSNLPKNICQSSAMSALLCVLHKSGGSHFRNVTTQAAAIKSNNFWIKQEEDLVRDRKSDQKEIQEIYDGQYQKFLSFGSSLHELYKIDLVRARLYIIWFP